jgi:hypothetical protein
LFFLAIKCIGDAIRAEEHRITCRQSQGQRLVVAAANKPGGIPQSFKLRQPFAER